MSMNARVGAVHWGGAVSQAGLDSLIWLGSLVFAAWVRHDFGLPTAQIGALLASGLMASVLQYCVGHPLFLYRGRYACGGFDEVLALGITSILTMLTVFIVNLLLPAQCLAPSIPLTAGALALIGMLGVRYVRRLRLERVMRPGRAATNPALIFGAGSGGTGLVRSMLHDPNGKYLPVGFIDDDPTKRHLRVSGIAVLGDREDLATATRLTGATTLVFAVPSAPSALVRALRSRAKACGLDFKVLPSIVAMLDRPVSVSDVRDVNITDLLGRGEVHTDLDAVAGYLTGQRILVTGAGGSIGSELCRQIHRFRPAELIMLDRDESALHAVQLSLHGRALLDGPEVVLADLRDRDRIRQVLTQRRPQVIFHAAALKHQPLLEQYPAEAVKTNVWGTATLLDAAATVGARVFVNISTDKAADPTSVLGSSKRIAERLTAHTAEIAGARYLSVRFGNVLGSRGSVLTVLAAQLAAGGPLTVTDPHVTRYFMTVEEAVQLVIQAGAIGRPGEALVLDMGEPVRIADLAQQMASLSSEPIDIVYTGLRPGEKLHEQLFGTGEVERRSGHPRICHVTVPPLDPDVAWLLDARAPRTTVIERLAALCAADQPGALRGADRPGAPRTPGPLRNIDPMLGPPVADSRRRGSSLPVTIERGTAR